MHNKRLTETNKQEIKEIYVTTMISNSLSTSCSLALPAPFVGIVAEENFILLVQK